jgi:hypothetical protein
MRHNMAVAIKFVNIKLLITDRFQIVTIKLVGHLGNRAPYHVPHVVMCITSAAVYGGGINTFVISSIDQPIERSNKSEVHVLTLMMMIVDIHVWTF